MAEVVRFGKCGVVCSEHHVWVIDLLQAVVTGCKAAMICTSYCPFYCFLTVLFVALVPPFLHTGLFPNK